MTPLDAREQRIPMEQQPKAILIAPDRRSAILDTGEIVPLTSFWIGEDEIDDPTIARSAVGPMADGRWLMVDFKHFETVRSH